MPLSEIKVSQEDHQPKEQPKEKVEEKPKDEKPEKPPEEVIIFSDNHNLDDYIIGKQIGQGAYALVFLGMCQKNNTKVALKIYQKEKMKDI